MPSENVPTTEKPDRRRRKREARREHLLDLAAELVDDHGVDGVTMTALAEAGDYAPASLYTYFGSRSELLAALQQRALAALGAVAEGALARWDELLADQPEPRQQVAALARLWAFGELFLAAPVEHRRDFRLQQELLVSAGAQDVADAAATVPAAMVVLDVPRRLLVEAQRCGAIADGGTTADPIDQPVDGAVVRTLAWLVSLNGALLTDGLPTGLPTTGAGLGREITAALLLGWGASSDDLAAARRLAATLVDPTTSDHQELLP